MADRDAFNIHHPTHLNIFDNLLYCEEYDRSIFCVGSTGSGKSSFCTFLTRDQSFLAESNLRSKTKCSRSGLLHFQNFQIMIIDSPGFTSFDEDNEQISAELCRAGLLARNGTDAVAFLINFADNFKDLNYLKGIKLLESFGGEFWKHAFIIFTHEDTISRITGYNSPIEFLYSLKEKNECPDIYMNILSKCNHRQMCIESVDKFHNKEYKKAKLGEMMEIIEQIRQANNGKRYKNYLMINGDKLVSMRLKTQKETENLQQEINILDKDLKAETEENTQLKTKIIQLKNEKLNLEVKLNNEIADHKKNVADIRQISYAESLTWYTIGVSVLGVAAIFAIKLLSK